MGKLFAAYLRRPRTRYDSRSDPYYVEGHFGSTGCHCTNLLHPKKSQVRREDRLCFIQGGTGRSRIVFITPPITKITPVRVKRRLCLKVSWTPSPPLKYEAGMPLTKVLGQCLNSKFEDPDLAHSYLRAFADPATNTIEMLKQYDAWCSKQKESAFAVNDRETLDPLDQKKMRATAYGLTGHFAPGSRISDWCGYPPNK